MDEFAQIRSFVWNQFGAAIDMLHDAIVACPADLWDAGTKQQDFWLTASHTVFWLDYYCSESRAAFVPTEPFGVVELDYQAVPVRAYTKSEVVDYLLAARTRAQAFVADTTLANNAQSMDTRRGGMPRLELIMYTMRHTQHHAGQLIRRLRLQAGIGSPWLGRGRP